jgi:hypothetical protein
MSACMATRSDSLAVSREDALPALCSIKSRTVSLFGELLESLPVDELMHGYSPGYFVQKLGPLVEVEFRLGRRADGIPRSALEARITTVRRTLWKAPTGNRIDRWSVRLRCARRQQCATGTRAVRLREHANELIRQSVTQRSKHSECARKVDARGERPRLTRIARTAERCGSAGTEGSG